MRGVAVKGRNGFVVSSSPSSLAACNKLNPPIPLSRSWAGVEGFVLVFIADAGIGASGWLFRFRLPVLALIFSALIVACCRRFRCSLIVQTSPIEVPVAVGGFGVVAVDARGIELDRSFNGG